MTTITSRAVAAAFASLIFASAAFAQSTATPAPGATPAPAKTTSTRQRSPESIECSKQADEKGLKGKERKKFRRECIKEARGAATKKQ
jgi:hypothetical protein